VKPFDVPHRVAPRLHRPVPVIGWGAFKIGRNIGAKYPATYEVPTDAQAHALVRQLVHDGVRLIDTAPAYGTSEERLGRALADLKPERRGDLFVSTKVGETLVQGSSRFDFSPAATAASVEESERRLGVAALDAVFVHSDGNDAVILRDSGCVEALEESKRRGQLRSVGFSPKTGEGAEQAIRHPLIDAVMLEIHPAATSLLPLLPLAHALGKAVFVKKPLASGTLDPAVAIPWILARPEITCIVIGGLDPRRLLENFRIAAQSA
jgi:aryl-alcohol dehydrogenase-like predicted oxidoreductase